MATHPDILLLAGAQDLFPELSSRAFDLLDGDIELRSDLVLVLFSQNLVLILPGMQRVQAFHMVVLFVVVVEGVAQLGLLRFRVESLMIEVVSFQVRGALILLVEDGR